MQNKIKVMVIDDDPELNNVLSHELEKTGFEVQSRLSGNGLIEYLHENPCHVILLDIQMPGKDGNAILHEIKESFRNLQVIMLTGFGTIDSAVKSVREGAFDYLTKPCDLGTIETTIHRAYKMLTLEQQNFALKHSLEKQAPLTEMVGISEKIREVKDFISRVAPTNSSVLLLGESGVGKEVAARAIHKSSNRREQPFLVVDCGALDENLLSSELFGHEKGAFTGAFKKKPGLLEIAQGGTIFLDEIGEISGAIQVKLLRFLETGQIRSLGGNRDITIDARVITSTNRDLKKEMEAGNFREDLFYRLNVIVSTLPPLRERIDDIPLLTEHFLGYMRDAGGKTKTISAAAMKYLCAYRWPGNVRELRNTLERMVILSKNEEILPQDLPKEIIQESGKAFSVFSNQLKSLEEIENDYILQVLQNTGGNRKETADILGIDVKTLYRKLKNSDRA